MTKAVGEGMAASYSMGAELPSNSPCLSNIEACDAEIDRVKNDTARQQAIKTKAEELMKRLKLL